MILIKGILGGVVAVLLAWAIIAGVYLWLLARSREPGSLGAIAGGWNYLLQVPAIVLLLSGAFGTGLFVTVRYVLRAKL